MFANIVDAAAENACSTALASMVYQFKGSRQSIQAKKGPRDSIDFVRVCDCASLICSGETCAGELRTRLEEVQTNSMDTVVDNP